jgi:hypothetical protein
VGGGFTKDAFGFMDILAFREDAFGCLAVQTTTVKKMKNHLRAYRQDEKVRKSIRRFLLSGNHFEIHGWERVFVATKSKAAKNPTRPVWTVTVMKIHLADITPL